MHNAMVRTEPAIACFMRSDGFDDIFQFKNNKKINFIKPPNWNILIK